MFLNARNRHAHSPNHRPLLLLLTACSPGGVTDQETDVVSFETAEPEAPYEDLEPVFFDHVRVVDPHDCVEDASFDPVTSVASLELGRAGAGVRAGAGLNLRLFDLLGWDDSVDREWHRDLASGTIEAPIPVPGLDCD
jgi:hypothetical protein